MDGRGGAAISLRRRRRCVSRNSRHGAAVDSEARSADPGRNPSRARAWLGRIRRVKPLLLCNAAVFLFACWVFGFVADEVREQEHLQWEKQVMLALRTGEPPHPIGPHWLAEVARDVTGLGSVAVLSFFVLLVTAFLLFTRRRVAALILLAASFGGLAINHTLKSAFSRARPDESLRLIEIESWSFPSGHAMSSATIYLTLAVLLTRLVERRREKTLIVGAALVISALVGVSRVFLGVHYPSDVVAGWAAGVAWAQVCWFASYLVSRRELERNA